MSHTRSPFGARPLAVAAALALACATSACGSCGRETTSPLAPGEAGTDAARGASASGGGADGGTELPARCTATTAELELEGGASLEVGDALLTPAGLSVSATLVRSGARVGVVFQSDPALSQVHAIELADLAGGDLAPRLFAFEGRVLVASYVRATTPRSLGNRPGAARVVATRTLSVAALGPGNVTPLFRLDQQADDSTAFDLVMTGKDSGFVAWDEDSERVVRGVVKVAPFVDGKLRAEGTVVATSYETDADSPGLVRTSTGEVMLGWLAREVITDGDGGLEGDADKQGAYLETSGEERARQWVQLTTLDAAGKPTGPVMSVTARAKSHATSFELTSTQGGVDAYVYDAVLRGESQGARILRVPVRSRKALPPEELLSGVGAAPSFLGEDLVGFVDLAERSMLLSPGASTRRLTREPLARGGRFVASAGGILYSVSVEVGADGGLGRAVLRRHTCP